MRSQHFHISVRDDDLSDHRLLIAGLSINIESAVGTKRSGVTATGEPWAVTMVDDYGYIFGAHGNDKDHVDVFVKPGTPYNYDGPVYVINQRMADSEKFDEHKVMLGYMEASEAAAAYYANYQDDWDGIKSIKPTTMAGLKDWLAKGDMSKEFNPNGFRIADRVFLHVHDEFKESEHPRAKNGEFGQGSGGSSSKPQRGEASKHLVSMNPAKYPAHIKALKIPPAWKDVKVSPDPKAALLVTGVDAKGRRQPIYNSSFSKTNAEAKFGRVQALLKEYDSIKNQNEKNRKSKDPIVAQTADCMALVMNLGLRPGAEKSTGAEKKAYGATNMLGTHVKIGAKGDVRLKFTGKKGVCIDLEVTDPNLKKMLVDRAKKAGKTGRIFPDVVGNRLLDYAHSLDGGHFKTKDFRTFVGTTTASNIVEGMEPPSTMTEYKKMVREVAVAVSKILGNTPIVALQSYINPTVFSKWSIDV